MSNSVRRIACSKPVRFVIPCVGALNRVKLCIFCCVRVSSSVSPSALRTTARRFASGIEISGDRSRRVSPSGAGVSASLTERGKVCFATRLPRRASIVTIHQPLLIGASVISGPDTRTATAPVPRKLAVQRSTCPTKLPDTSSTTGDPANLEMLCRNCTDRQ